MGDTGQNISLEFPYFSRSFPFSLVLDGISYLACPPNGQKFRLRCHFVPFCPILGFQALVDDPLAGHRNKERQTTDRAAVENIRYNDKQRPWSAQWDNCQQIGAASKASRRAVPCLEHERSMRYHPADNPSTTNALQEPTCPRSSPFPEGYTAITPYLIVENAAGFIEFLVSAFGAVERLRMPMPEGGIGHAEVEIGGAVPDAFRRPAA